MIYNEKINSSIFKNTNIANISVLFGLDKSDFYSELKSDMEKLKKDDKLYYRNILNIKLNEFSKTNIFELNYFLEVKFY